MFLLSVLWIRTWIHMDPHNFGNLDPHQDPHPHQIKIRIRINVLSWIRNRIRIRINLQMNPPFSAPCFHPHTFKRYGVAVKYQRVYQQRYYFLLQLFPIVLPILQLLL